MNAYASALAAWLAPQDRAQERLGAAIKRSQAAVSRYAKGDRFPDAGTARLIEKATSGVVPFALWREVAAQRFGLAA